jgi:hypothetical protein
MPWRQDEWVRVLEASKKILFGKLELAVAAKTAKAPDTTEGALGLDTGTPLNRHPQKSPSDWGSRWLRARESASARCSLVGARGAVPES